MLRANVVDGTSSISLVRVDSKLFLTVILLKNISIWDVCATYVKIRLLQITSQVLRRQNDKLSQTEHYINIRSRSFSVWNRRRIGKRSVEYLQNVKVIAVWNFYELKCCILCGDVTTPN